MRSHPPLHHSQEGITCCYYATDIFIPANQPTANKPTVKVLDFVNTQPRNIPKTYPPINVPHRPHTTNYRYYKPAVAAKNTPTAKTPSLHSGLFIFNSFGIVAEQTKVHLNNDALAIPPKHLQPKAAYINVIYLRIDFSLNRMVGNRRDATFT